MHALVTGGGGFIGSHLTERLLAEGCRVTVLDNFSTGTPANIEHLQGHANFQLVHGSILDERLLESVVEQADIVYHLASAVGVRLIIEQPVQTIQTIVEGTDNVLRRAKHKRCPVLITSTSEVYGKGSKVPFSESDDVVLGPTTTRRWAYASAKMLDEFLALAHWYESQLPVICVRLFNTVGPRQTGQYGMVLPRFVQQALSGEPITVYGDGEQTRCFCHVADAVGALLALSRCPQAAGKVVNVGSDQEVTMNQLAARVQAITQSSSPVRHVPYREAYVEGFEDMRRRVPDLTLARQLVGYRPGHDLDAIIASIVSYWRASKVQNSR